MAFNRRKMMDKFTERFVDLVCAYRRAGLSNDDLKFMIELFVADQMDKADTKEVAHSTSNNTESDAIALSELKLILDELVNGTETGIVDDDVEVLMEKIAQRTHIS